jgi:hypothetical protein
LGFNLVWFLHSDSPFSRQKKMLLAYQGFERGVATFYDLPGISLRQLDCSLPQRLGQLRPCWLAAPKVFQLALQL